MEDRLPVYTHITQNACSKLFSPLDLLYIGGNYKELVYF